MKNLKRIRIYRTIALVSLIIFIFFSVVCFNVIAHKAYITNENFSNENVLENMQYSFNGDEFYDFDSFEQLHESFSENDLIIKGTINTDGLINPVIAIKTNSNYYDAYVDGDKILEKEKENIFNNFVSIDVANIPPSYNGEEIEVFLFSNNPKNICKGVEIYTTNKYYFMTNILVDGVLNTSFCVFASISGLLLLFSYLSPRYRHYGLYIIGYLISLVSLICLFSFNEFIILIVNNLYLISIIKIISICQIPICIMLFAKKYDKSIQHKKGYKRLAGVYIVFLIILLTLQVLDIITIRYLMIFVATVMFLTTLIALKNLINVAKINLKVGLNLKDVEKQHIAYANGSKLYKFDGSFFDRYMPILFSIFLIVNNIGIILFLIFDDSSMYVLPLATVVTVMVIACIVVFTFDLKVVNNVAATNQEVRILNKNRVDLLISQQMRLFESEGLEEICYQFINCIKKTIFPYKIDNKEIFNLHNKNVREKYIKDYNAFISSSSLVCIRNSKKNNIDRPEYEVLVSTGRFSGYDSLEYKKQNNLDEFDVIDSIMNRMVKFSDEDIFSFIGSDEDPVGVVLIRDLSGIEPIIKSLLELYIKTCAMVIENSIVVSETKLVRKDILYNLNELVELRVQQNGHHIERVSKYSRVLAEKLGIDARNAEIIELASSMHDIGKISISDKILNKPDKLTKAEFDIIKSHSQIGYDVLNNTDNEIIKAAALISKYHHEKYNGKGYYGLKGEEIPEYARIVAVADVFDALSVKKVYKDSWEIEKIIELFEKEKGEHFDEQIVNILLENIDEFIKIRDKYSESYEV